MHATRPLGLASPTLPLRHHPVPRFIKSVDVTAIISVSSTYPSLASPLFQAGVAIGHGGASTVKGNTIRDGSGGSLLCLSSQSKGLICANVIDQDAGATLQVPDGLLPEVQEQNLIRFIGQVHLSC